MILCRRRYTVFKECIILYYDVGEELFYRVYTLP